LDTHTKLPDDYNRAKLVTDYESYRTENDIPPNGVMPHHRAQQNIGRLAQAGLYGQSDAAPDASQFLEHPRRGTTDDDGHLMSGSI
ncbi:hypothetical protein, partial [Ralstonia pickettii]|uniref:hypothetical protein n=1 Tax=Ralstonia pickettii TaxID=329 RepID=UPI0029C9C71C